MPSGEDSADRGNGVASGNRERRPGSGKMVVRLGEHRGGERGCRAPLNPRARNGPPGSESYFHYLVLVSGVTTSVGLLSHKRCYKLHVPPHCYKDECINIAYSNILLTNLSRFSTHRALGTLLVSSRPGNRDRSANANVLRTK